ncbi:fructose 1,6-bisphosphatase II [Actinobacillus pleuropneumoniae]|uniref:class II fructose-bisphosphatase n=1 Tax=Actinobacillus pleuropneumoniae TaxID=715 RepID=UPI0001E49ED7|nr:class II fructose-bisphosphatase [Actinobacillus pleuropneumoniae]EFM90209.1 Fructose-1,6-bisphosphatase class 2 [Actinobacillus pleuropneumoniae serovar 4 str. M62]UKH40995.1 class II fructose-bisphosphatase [Actinobacillus pleuropneumoniae serovar 4 str. M62]SQF64521.1 fructose 1,6-bisphosphatase II [Actinobacillus pleuropneumoniae]
MKRAISFEFSRVTEAAALAAYEWIGRGDKNAADDAAVKAMRLVMNKMEIRGEIVIGEGEIDEAPMLYIGEKVGRSQPEDKEVAIAVDPIDGTRMTAMGQAGALSVLAAGSKETFLQALDMYMEKLVVDSEAKGMIDLDLPLEQNIRRVASKKGKLLTQMTVAILAKPRHDEIIKTVQKLGVKVMAIPDGDVAAAVQCCLPDSDLDLVYGIGGAPEGVVAAAAVRALGGDIQGRLIPRNQVKDNSPENLSAAEKELSRCAQMNVPVNKVLKLEDLVRDDNVLFAATGITTGDLLKGVQRKGSMMFTETLLIRGRSRTIRKLASYHDISRLSED